MLPSFAVLFNINQFDHPTSGFGFILIWTCAIGSWLTCLTAFYHRLISPCVLRCMPIMLSSYNNLVLFIVYICLTHRHQGWGFSRSTKRCSGRKQWIQIFSWFVMILTYLNGLLLSRYVLSSHSFFWRFLSYPVAVVLSFGFILASPFLIGAFRNSIWGWCISAGICYSGAVSLAASSSSILDKNLSS